MEEDELIKSLIEANRQTIGDDDLLPASAEAFDEAMELGPLIRNEALRVRGDFTMATDSATRHTLKTRYALLDQWMGELKAIESRGEASQIEGLKRDLRARILDELRKWRSSGAMRQRREDELESRRKQLLEKQKAGAGGATHRRIKDEIELLLKNYSPANENRIETLIDQWRRSGDPSYDPSVALRLRNARKKKDDSGYAL